MNVLNEKLEIIELLLKTENEVILKKIKSIFTGVRHETKIPSGKRRKLESPKKNGIKQGFRFNWEGGLKEMRDEFDGVKLQHHINSLRK